MVGIRLGHTESRLVSILQNRMVSAKDLAEMLGRGYDEQKVQSMVLSLARKGLVDKTKAALLLRGTPMAKFLSYSFGSKLKGNMPKGRAR